MLEEKNLIFKKAIAIFTPHSQNDERLFMSSDFSTLSRSEKIAASLEIANMLNQITNLNIPLFIDDSESYPDFDFINKYKNNQIFIAQVKKGRTLKITNGQEVIAGFNTTKHLYKKSKQTSQLTKVA